MSDKAKTVRAAAYAPDGTEVTYDAPPNKWNVAGLVQSTDGGWFEAAHGGSYDSVRGRAVTYAYRFGYNARTVAAVTIYEATAPAVREYFGHHKVNITQVFKPGDGGWQDAKLHGGWSNIRKLSKQGVTAVAFESFDTTGLDTRIHIGPAEFEVASLLKSMNLPKQKQCATIGHGHLPATHKISYDYRGEGERITEYVCTKCDKQYGRRPVLQNFESAPLAR
jgi:hypothetical protein